MIRSRIGLRKNVLVMITAIAVMSATALPVAWGQATAAPSIKFLSPTSFAGETPVLTDTSTGVNTAYRLTAWTANAPQGSLVEFELVPGDGLTNPVTIGAGRPVAGDTYEYQWDIAEGPPPIGIPEGSHELRVNLYDANNEQIAGDAMKVVFAHGAAEKTEDLPSFDLTYPANGGPMGQYTASNGRTNSVLDTTTQANRPRFTVLAWFTTSAPGTSPVWKLCSSGESAVGYEDGVRCTYPTDDPATKEVDEGVDPTRVTAVGVAGKTREDGTADIVRVLPYQQEPTGASSQLLGKSKTSGGPSTSATTGNPPSFTQQKDSAGRFPCSDWFRVKVTDQVGRTIAGANVDAHAQGPSDQLKFHNGYLSADLPPVLQPPSEGHSFPEKAAICNSTHDKEAQQGEHSLGGQPDRKHIETVFGTRDNGLIDFALHTDQPGTTQLTAWADKKDDDKFCSGEPSASTAFGWGTDQAPPVNGEQPSDCVTVPEPDPTEEPFDGSRSAAIEPSATAVRTGRSTTIVGSIEAPNDLCEAGQVLKLKAKKPSARRFRAISSGTTDGFGLASFKVKVERTKDYRVVAPAAGECALAKSTIRKIRAI